MGKGGGGEGMRRRREVEVGRAESGVGNSTGERLC